MKKCSSCTKDLPDAALHCVFCGAKQAPAAAAPMAKTMMGFSSNDMIDQLKAQGKPIPPQLLQGQGQPAGVVPAPALSLPPMNPAPMTPPASPSFSGGGGQQAPTMFAAGPPPGATLPTPAAPPKGAQAPTMFASGPPPGMAAGLSNAPAGGTALGVGAPPSSLPPAPTPPPAYTPPAPAYAPPAPAIAPYSPQAYAPGPVPQYLASNTAAQAGRPIEPWKDGLRLQMFIWGGLLLLAFLLPISMRGNTTFSWDLIADAPGKAKIAPLLTAAAGLLAIVFAAMPLATVARAVLALVLGLAGVVTPIFLHHDFPGWQSLSGITGALLLAPGLLLRDEYRMSILPRVLVTVGALAALAPYLVPNDAGMPFVNLFKMIIDGPGELKIGGAIGVGYVVLVLLSLLAWLPSPGSGGAKVIMWLLLSWGALGYVVSLIVNGHIGDIPDAPAAALWWATGIPGGGNLEIALLGMPMAYGVLVAYGGASTLGKNLE